MAVYSMTGYASASSPRHPHTGAASAPQLGSDRTCVTVDIRSVNSRYLDLGFRLPDELRAIEPALRDRLGQRLKRGKVELRVHVQSETGAQLAPPPDDQLLALAQVQAAIQARFPQSAALSVHEVAQWCRGTTTPQGLDDTALATADACLTSLLSARAREGARLVQILRERTQGLRVLAQQAQPLVPAVVERQQQRFLERWQQALEAAGGSARAEQAQERALGEAATYALRIDVAEELGRLDAHLGEIDRLLDRGGEVGKRMDFLIQELHREANTLGSKSSALELTQISIEMKVLIEQMREQVQNIE